MKTEEQFEKLLASQPQRPIPTAWREAVLCAARTKPGFGDTQPSRRPSLLRNVESELLGWLWPHPRAWAALAAVWLVLLTVNLAMRDPAPPRLAGRTEPPFSGLQQMLRQQHLMLTEMFDQGERPEANRPKPAAPRPRTERRSDFLNA